MRPSYWQQIPTQHVPPTNFNQQPYYGNNQSNNQGYMNRGGYQPQMPNQTWTPSVNEYPPQNTHHFQTPQNSNFPPSQAKQIVQMPQALPATNDGNNVDDALRELVIKSGKNPDTITTTELVSLLEEQQSTVKKNNENNSKSPPGTSKAPATSIRTSWPSKSGEKHQESSVKPEPKDDLEAELDSLTDEPVSLNKSGSTFPGKKVIVPATELYAAKLAAERVAALTKKKQAEKQQQQPPTPSSNNSGFDPSQQIPGFNMLPPEQQEMMKAMFSQYMQQMPVGSAPMAPQQQAMSGNPYSFPTSSQRGGVLPGLGGLGGFSEEQIQEMLADRYLKQARIAYLGQLMEVLKQQVSHLFQTMCTAGRGKIQSNPAIRCNESLQDQISADLRELAAEVRLLDKYLGPRVSQTPSDEALAKAKQQRQKPELEKRVEFFDNGRHWCKECAEFHDNISGLVAHLSGSSHARKFLSRPENLSLSELPAYSLLLDKNTANSPDDTSAKSPKEEEKDSSDDKGAPLEQINKIPLRGSEFISPILSTFHCQLCDIYVVGNGKAVSEHLSTKKHYRKYLEYCDEQPYYEKLNEINRTAAMIDQSFNNRGSAPSHSSVEPSRSGPERTTRFENERQPPPPPKMVPPPPSIPQSGFIPARFEPVAVQPPRPKPVDMFASTQKNEDRRRSRSRERRRRSRSRSPRRDFNTKSPLRQPQVAFGNKRISLGDDFDTSSKKKNFDLSNFTITDKK